VKNKKGKGNRFWRDGEGTGRENGGVCGKQQARPGRGGGQGWFDGKGKKKNTERRSGYYNRRKLRGRGEGDRGAMVRKRKVRCGVEGCLGVKNTMHNVEEAGERGVREERRQGPNVILGEKLGTRSV